MKEVKNIIKLLTPMMQFRKFSRIEFMKENKLGDYDSIRYINKLLELKYIHLIIEDDKRLFTLSLKGSDAYKEYVNKERLKLIHNSRGCIFCHKLYKPIRDAQITCGHEECLRAYHREYHRNLNKNRLFLKLT